jgi:hypothetical protein
VLVDELVSLSDGQIILSPVLHAAGFRCETSVSASDSAIFWVVMLAVHAVGFWCAARACCFAHHVLAETRAGSRRPCWGSGPNA